MLGKDITIDDDHSFNESCFIKEFKGTFDGKGYTIFGLDMPLFCDIEDGTVKNLFLKDMEITNQSLFLMGTIAMKNRGSIENVHVYGSIYGNSSVGGLVGYNQGSIINSSFSGTIDSPTSNHNGGIVSLNEGSISHSYSIGEISGNTGVGGISGVSDGGLIVNCYSKMNVVGTNYVAGIVGFLLDETLLQGLIVYGDITSDSYVGVITNGFFTYEDRVLFTGQITGPTYIIEDNVYYTSDQTFIVSPENSLNIEDIDEDFYINQLGLNLSIWEIDYENLSILPLLKENAE